MVMDQKIPDLNDQPVEPGIGRVSGLDSFMDSSGTSKSGGLGQMLQIILLCWKD